jgi:hypothetical protein
MLVATIASCVMVWIGIHADAPCTRSSDERNRARFAIALVAALVVLPETMSAHVGSPDVFLDGQPGRIACW